MTKSEIIKDIVSSVRHLNISKIILFGSYAKKEQTPDSDIDLLVVTKDNFVFQTFTQKIAVKLDIANALHNVRKVADIDLIVHTKPMFEQFILLDSGFKKEIMRHGEVIYENNN